MREAAVKTRMSTEIETAAPNNSQKTSSSSPFLMADVLVSRVSNSA